LLYYLVPEAGLQKLGINKVPFKPLNYQYKILGSVRSNSEKKTDYVIARKKSISKLSSTKQIEK